MGHRLYRDLYELGGWHVECGEGRHLVKNPSIESPSRAVFANPSPLFEKEGDFRLLALRLD
jgi:hypothetical protein